MWGNVDKNSINEKSMLISGEVARPVDMKNGVRRPRFSRKSAADGIFKFLTAAKTPETIQGIRI